RPAARCGAPGHMASSRACEEVPTMSSVQTTLAQPALDALLGRLAGPNRQVASRYPVETGKRQPVHTVYGGAHLFKADSAAKLGAIAIRMLDEHGADPIAFAEAIGLEVPAELARAIHQRVRAKLEREPIEDFRIDFEDGYGNRPDEEEDGHARAAALEVAAGMANKSLPPYIGIRIKPLTEELARRALRTLDIFVSTV